MDLRVFFGVIAATGSVMFIGQMKADVHNGDRPAVHEDGSGSVPVPANAAVIDIAVSRLGLFSSG